MTDDTPISRFLATYSGQTLVAYRAALLLFFDYLSGEPKRDPKKKKRITAEVMAGYDAAATAYLANGRNVVYDVQGYIRYMENEAGLQPKTVVTYKNSVMTWLTMSDVEIRRSQARLIASKTPYPEKMTDSVVLNREFVAGILVNGAPPPHLKALVLVLASSGMRLGEALALTMADVDLDASPAIVWVRRSGSRKVPKSGQRRVTFITSEATEALKQWLDYRPTWLANKAAFVEKRTRIVRDEDGTERKVSNLRNFERIRCDAATEKRIFPCCRQDVTDDFYAALKRATGSEYIDPDTGRHLVHLHSFRTFFNVALKSAGGNAHIIAEQLIGHRGYLGGAYDKMTVEKKAEFYAENEHLLWIVQRKEITPDMEKETAALRDRIAALEADRERDRQQMIEMWESWKRRQDK
ncbi:MAG: tyrosine-type recombinase/integrase [bacterium]